MKLKHPMIVLLLLLCFVACKDVFEPKIDTPETGYLVVEGYVNAGTGTSIIKLSRTSKFQTSPINPLLKAKVNIVGENLETYPVKEKKDGIYETDTITLTSQKYRLKIETDDGKSYLSDLLEEKETPAIDSISWRREAGGVRIYANTHDNLNKTKYYKWTFEETWEIRSQSRSFYKFISVTDPVTKVSSIELVKRPPGEDSLLFFCWKYGKSNQIIIGSTANLSKDIITQPIAFIPNGDDRLSQLYSINVKQSALNLESYNFYNNLKSNTETNGSIFDKQPTETRGNIHCISDSKEQVIGFVMFASLQEKRKFIPNLSSWNRPMNCNYKLIANNPDTISKYAGPSYIALAPHSYSPSGAIINIDIGPSDCVDCTLRGSNVKPSFWPN